MFNAQQYALIVADVSLTSCQVYLNSTSRVEGFLLTKTSPGLEFNLVDLGFPDPPSNVFFQLGDEGSRLRVFLVLKRIGGQPARPSRVKKEEEISGKDFFYISEVKLDEGFGVDSLSSVWLYTGIAGSIGLLVIVLVFVSVCFYIRKKREEAKLDKKKVSELPKEHLYYSKNMDTFEQSINEDDFENKQNIPIHFKQESTIKHYQ